METENTTSEQDENNNQFPYINPTGKGGFAEHPENINRDGRTKNEQRVGYWLQFFKNMTGKEFKDYLSSRSADDMYVAEVFAVERIKRARTNLEDYDRVVDRTEGKSQQTLIHEGGFFSESELIMRVVSGKKKIVEDKNGKE